MTDFRELKHVNPDLSEVVIRAFPGVTGSTVTSIDSGSVMIGTGVSFHGSVNLRSGVTVGNNVSLTECDLQKGVSVGERSRIMGTHEHPATIGLGTKIGNQCFISSSIGADSHIGHRVTVYYELPVQTKIGNRSSVALNIELPDLAPLAGSIHIGEGSTIFQDHADCHALNSLTVGDSTNVVASQLIGDVSFGNRIRIGTFYSEDHWENPGHFENISIPDHVHVPERRVFKAGETVVFTVGATDKDRMTVLKSAGQVTEVFAEFGEPAPDFPPAALAALEQMHWTMDEHHKASVKTLKGRVKAAEARAKAVVDVLLPEVPATPDKSAELEERLVQMLRRLTEVETKVGIPTTSH